jgi:hypothetical protein
LGVLAVPCVRRRHLSGKSVLTLYSGTSKPSTKQRVHIYDVYDNELNEAYEIPNSDRTIFQDFDSGFLDVETQKIPKEVEKSFTKLEFDAQSVVTDLLDRTVWSEENTKRSIPFNRRDVETLRKYFVFLRFRNSVAYRQMVVTLEESSHEEPKDGQIFNAYRPVIVQLRKRYILRGFIDFLEHSWADGVIRSRSDQRLPTGWSVDTFQDVMNLYCWRLCEAEVCVGIASEDQEFMLADCCFGSLDEGFDEDPWVYRFPQSADGDLTLSLHSSGNVVISFSPSSQPLLFTFSARQMNTIHQSPHIARLADQRSG